MKKIAVLALLIAVIVLSACSNAADITEKDVSFSVSNTTVAEITSEVDVTKNAETTTTEPSTTEISTKKQIKTTTTTTQKHQKEMTAAKPQQSTTKKTTTTKKPTTTKAATTKKKETTTKKQTTTKAKTCTGNGNHSQSCGNMGRWFNSRSEVKAYVDKEMKYWADLEESGQITREEYYKKCPSGYECWSCAYCGKWTGNFKY
ncbi:MAG: hypothetical protein IKF64_05835 [Eubacterium sp.]|nr:hypothetical protein [Eubacterium sp.]